MDDMKVALDLLLTEHPAFEWTRRSGTREFTGKLRWDDGVRVKIQRGEHGWEAGARVDGEKADALESIVCLSPCDAMANLMARCMFRALTCEDAGGAQERAARAEAMAAQRGDLLRVVRAERDDLKVQMNNFMAANATLERMRAEADRAATRAEDRRDEALLAVQAMEHERERAESNQKALTYLLEETRRELDDARSGRDIAAVYDEMERMRVALERERDNARECANIRMAELGEEVDAMMRERDDIQQHAWQVEKERDELRASLASSKGVSSDYASELEGANNRAINARRAMDEAVAECQKANEKAYQQSNRADRWQATVADLLAQIAALKQVAFDASRRLQAEIESHRREIDALNDRLKRAGQEMRALQLQSDEPSLAQDLAESMREVRHG